jgi:hypothetical protein
MNVLFIFRNKKARRKPDHSQGGENYFAGMQSCLARLQICAWIGTASRYFAPAAYIL